MQKCDLALSELAHGPVSVRVGEIVVRMVRGRKFSSPRRTTLWRVYAVEPDAHMCFLQNVANRQLAKVSMSYIRHGRWYDIKMSSGGYLSDKATEMFLRELVSNENILLKTMKVKKIHFGDRGHQSRALAEAAIAHADATVFKGVR